MCISVFVFITSKKISEKSNIGFSCAISYFLLSIVSFLRANTFFNNIPDSPIINSAISICIGLTLTVVIGLIYTRLFFKKIMVKLFHKTPNDDIWRDVLDLENGSALKVYLKNEPYYVIGKHKSHEENGNESWLAVQAFAKYDKVTNENYKNEPSFLDDNNVIYTVRFSDVEHIEIFQI